MKRKEFIKSILGLPLLGFLGLGESQKTEQKAHAIYPDGTVKDVSTWKDLQKILNE